MRTRLTAVTRTQGATSGLKDGRIVPEHYTLDFIEVPVLVDAFRRMVRLQEFDVCEMAVTTYMCAKAHGVPITAIPTFLVRGFHHGAILVDTRSGIDSPKQLEGLRVGVNRGWTVTTGVWARGILRDEFGVDLNEITWVCSGDEHVEDFTRPANVVGLEGGDSLESLLLSGRLDAVVGLDHMNDPRIGSLIARPTEAAISAMRRDHFSPVNHLVVVKDDVLAAHPDAARELFDAFVSAKQSYIDQVVLGIPDPSPADQFARVVFDETGQDPLPYGIEPNRAVLERLMIHAVDQGILSSAVSIESLFADQVRDLVG